MWQTRPIGKTTPTKTGDTLNDDMVALIATLTVCIQNNEDPEKPDSPEPTTKDYVAAMVDRTDDMHRSSGWRQAAIRWQYRSPGWLHTHAKL